MSLCLRFLFLVKIATPLSFNLLTHSTIQPDEYFGIVNVVPHKIRYYNNHCATPRTFSIQSIDSIDVAGIPVLQQADNAKYLRPPKHPGAARPTPQCQEALPYLYDWKNGVGGSEKHRELQSKALHAQIPAKWSKNKIRKERCGWTWPWKDTCRALLDCRSLGIFYSYCRLATLPPCCRQATVLCTFIAHKRGE